MNVKFICVQPRLVYYAWQLEVMINNFIKLGIDANDINILLACSLDPNDRTNQRDVVDLFDKLVLNFKDVNFFFYKDTRVNPCYISSIRPNILKQHFTQFPELKGDAIFYHDCDIVFSKKPDLSNFIDDDIWYVSDTVGYIGASYILSKGLDVYNKMCNIIGIDVDIPKNQEQNSGGAQYLMKNLTSEFWQKVEGDSEKLYSYFLEDEPRKMAMNPSYHPIQKWTSDMWSVLWNAWFFKNEVKVDKYFDFTWANEPIDNWDKNFIYHNAGVVGPGESFFKGGYVNSLPYSVIDTFNPNLASYNYYKEIIETGKNSCLTNNSISGCFSIGTSITLIDGSSKPIEEMLIGDKVLSINENSEIVENTITNIISLTVSDIILLKINNTIEITTTEDHPFFVGDKYVKAGNLKVGNKLKQIFNGVLYSVALNDVKHLTQDTIVYNITTDPDHTFFANNVLVHNKSI